MFDVLISLGDADTGRRVADVLRGARMRVIALTDLGDVAAANAFHVDVGVACSSHRDAGVATVASMRAALTGPPPVLAVVPRIAGPDVRAAGATDVLPENTSDDVIVLRVQRAATDSAREASRIVLRGRLRDMSLGAIAESMTRRWEFFHVRVKSASRRGECSYRRGVMVHARVDGVPSDEAMNALVSFGDGDFEVIAEGNAITRPQASSFPTPVAANDTHSATGMHRSVRDEDPMQSMSATGRAAALMNALAAHARVWLPPKVVAAVLRASYAASTRAIEHAPRFDVSDDAMAIAVGVPREGAIPRLVSLWVPDFLARCEALAPTRFRRDRLSEVLGNLRGLAERAGWQIDRGAAQVGT